MIKQSVELWLPQLQDSDKPGTSSSQKECSQVCFSLDTSYGI